MTILSQLGDPPGSQDRSPGDHFRGKRRLKSPTPNDPKRPESVKKSVHSIFIDFGYISVFGHSSFLFSLIFSNFAYFSRHFFLFVLCFYTNIAIQFGTILHSSAQRFPYKFSHRFRNNFASFGPTVCQIFLHRRCLHKYVDSTIASDTMLHYLQDSSRMAGHIVERESSAPGAGSMPVTFLLGQCP